MSAINLNSANSENIYPNNNINNLLIQFKNDLLNSINIQNKDINKRLEKIESDIHLLKKDNINEHNNEKNKDEDKQKRIMLSKSQIINRHNKIDNKRIKSHENKETNAQKVSIIEDNESIENDEEINSDNFCEDSKDLNESHEEKNDIKTFSNKSVSPQKKRNKSSNKSKKRGKYRKKDDK